MSTSRPSPMRRTRGVRIAALVAAASLVFAACSSDSDSSSDTTAADGSLSGTIEISGSSTVEPISTWVADGYDLAYLDGGHP